MNVFATQPVIFLLTLHSVRGPVKLVLLCETAEKVVATSVTADCSVRQPVKLLLIL